MDRAFVLTHGHIFDVMETVFNAPMSSFQLKQALRDADRRRQAGYPIADRLFPDAFGLPASADLKDLLQARPIGVAASVQKKPECFGYPNAHGPSPSFARVVQVIARPPLLLVLPRWGEQRAHADLPGVEAGFL